MPAFGSLFDDHHPAYGWFGDHDSGGGDGVGADAHGKTPEISERTIMLLFFLSMLLTFVAFRYIIWLEREETKIRKSG